MSNSELKLDTKIKVPKTPEDQLRQLLDAVNQMFKILGPQKSDPLVQLYRAGELNFDFVINEADLIRQKKSKLSVGKRAAVIYLVKTAVNQFRQNQAMGTPQQKQDEKPNVNEQKDNG